MDKLYESLDYQQHAFDNLKAVNEKQTNKEWQQPITTKKFGKIGRSNRQNYFQYGLPCRAVVADVKIC